ncbi:MAG: prephenate dehydrogenase/arogenate dehydrogenase family protein [Dehalococcoidia bacterium]
MAEETTPKQKITIVGLGLIGGSIGLGLKAAGLKKIRIVGHDRDGGVMAKARKRGAVDETEHNLINAVRGSSCVIVSVPVMSIRRVFQDIASHMGENSIVHDTGSSKLEVLKWAADELPRTVHFVGGHPMAGKEEGGIDAAEATLFKDATYCVSPLPSASQASVEAILGLISVLGAKPLFVDPEEHDRYAAAISHMPMVLSNALFSVARGSKAWFELSRMAGPGFKDLTRLASQDPEMQLDVLRTNQEGVVHWLDRMQDEITHWKELVQGDEETLFQALYRSNLDREEYIKEGPKQAEFSSRPEVASGSDQLADMLFGARMMRRIREVTSFYEEKAKEAPPRRKN